jgi:hypothetical protein
MVAVLRVLPENPEPQAERFHCLDRMGQETLLGVLSLVLEIIVHATWTNANRGQRGSLSGNAGKGDASRGVAGGPELSDQLASNRIIWASLHTDRFFLTLGAGRGCPVACKPLQITASHSEAQGEPTLPTSNLLCGVESLPVDQMSGPDGLSSAPRVQKNVRPDKADMFSGSQSHQGKSQKPCSSDGSQSRRRNDLKPINKATSGVVSESPGRNESERRCSLDSIL